MNKSRRPIVAGNWKMFGTQTEISSLLENIKKALPNSSLAEAEMMVFPPFIFIDQVQKLLTGTKIQWGGQNCASELKGAFTGEISAPMLMEFGCRHVLVGHSERRQLFGEDDKIVSKKFALAREVGLSPILCLGETLQQREKGQTQAVVSGQLSAVLAANGGVQALENAIIAYEPVWAIGTGLTATPDQAEEIHAMLRAEVAKLSADVADRVRILYGGSVKAANAKALFAMPNIDGGLIGGASLSAEEFLQIYHAAG